MVQQKNENGETFYRVAETFEDAHESLFKEKDDQMEAVKSYRQKLINSKMVGLLICILIIMFSFQLKDEARELSSAQMIKKHFIPYEAYITLATQLCVTEANEANPYHAKRRFFGGFRKKKPEPEVRIKKVYEDKDPWDP